VTGWRVTDVPWAGVRLRDVLDAASPQREARAVRFVSFDGAYSESLTMQQARRDDVLVAYELEGEPLSSDHGGPARLYVAPMYGYKSLKWLSTIELTADVVPGYWEQRGYDVDGWVGRSNGRDDEAT
jgi:DMSO/TMAO reductase YedYZ molybdopterin-dependent catalytic subunit